MMYEVSKQPVSVAIYAGTKNWQFYESGVLKSCCDKELDPDCSDIGYGIDHAVTITGYYTKTNTKNGKTTGHWKVQNSWGTEWGMNGHMKIGLFGEDQGVCNINKYGVFTANF